MTGSTYSSFTTMKEKETNSNFLNANKLKVFKNLLKVRTEEPCSLSVMDKSLSTTSASGKSKKLTLEPDKSKKLAFTTDKSLNVTPLADKSSTISALANKSLKEEPADEKSLVVTSVLNKPSIVALVADLPLDVESANKDVKKESQRKINRKKKRLRQNPLKVCFIIS